MLSTVARPLYEGFEIPPKLIATEPAESRGLSRDGVRLMAADTSGVSHHSFFELPDLLDEGDLLVVNNSGTLASAVDVDHETSVHFSTRLPGGLLVVEPRSRIDNFSRPLPLREAGTLLLPGQATLELLAPYPVDSDRPRLWVAHLDTTTDFGGYLARHGRPIQYAGLERRISIDAYQTVFASTPGSSEMPSAGRPFSASVIARLVGKGVGISPLTLHTGVSSLETGEPPYAEWFEVPAATAEAVNSTTSRGNRVIAVGTTVVRALTTTTDPNGAVHPGRGWTEVVVSPGSTLPPVGGLITGWHEPESSHLDMLSALAPTDVLEASYAEAIAQGYLWHEFGDSHLILQ